ncbi:UNVERIFIED_ORG: hypothetical protein ABIB52_000357 [Arthrobacter sp. UYCu721]
MLAVTRAAHAMSVKAADEPAGPVLEPEPGDWDSVSVRTTEAQTQQFVTLHEALLDFDDSAAVLEGDLPRPTCHCRVGRRRPRGSGSSGRNAQCRAAAPPVRLAAEGGLGQVATG